MFIGLVTDVPLAITEDAETHILVGEFVGEHPDVDGVLALQGCNQLVHQFLGKVPTALELGFDAAVVLLKVAHVEILVLEGFDTVEVSLVLRACEEDVCSVICHSVSVFILNYVKSIV